MKTFRFRNDENSDEEKKGHYSNFKKYVTGYPFLNYYFPTLTTASGVGNSYDNLWVEF